MVGFGGRLCGHGAEMLVLALCLGGLFLGPRQARECKLCACSQNIGIIIVNDYCSILIFSMMMIKVIPSIIAINRVLYLIMVVSFLFLFLLLLSEFNIVANAVVLMISIFDHCHF